MPDPTNKFNPKRTAQKNLLESMASQVQDMDGLFKQTVQVDQTDKIRELEAKIKQLEESDPTRFQKVFLKQESGLYLLTAIPIII